MRTCWTVIREASPSGTGVGFGTGVAFAPSGFGGSSFFLAPGAEGGGGLTGAAGGGGGGGLLAIGGTSGAGPSLLSHPTDATRIATTIQRMLPPKGMNTASRRL